jgi:hypothetical protein
MPTPALPLLHQLLAILHIPIHPPTISSISPSLLLLILESLLSQRLILPHGARLCKTEEDEISVIKCILGVLADDLLSMDLTLVDPRKVVEGSERELEVVIMAFAVVAKRKGMDLRPEREDYLSYEELVDEGEEKLQEPIEPDISFSSPTLGEGSTSESEDVFRSYRGLSRSDTLTERLGNEEERLGDRRDGSRSSREGTKTVLDEILEEFGV